MNRLIHVLLLCPLFCIGASSHAVQAVAGPQPAAATQSEANRILGSFLAAYENMDKLDVVTRELAGKHNIQGMTDAAMASASEKGLTVQVDGTTMLVMRRERLLRTREASACWVLPKNASADPTPPRIEQILQAGSRWSFFHGPADESVRQIDAKLDLNELREWLSQPFATTFEISRAFDHVVFMVEFLSRVLPLDPDLQLRVLDQDKILLVSSALGLEVKLTSDGSLVRVRHTESGDRVREVTYRGEFPGIKLPAPFPQYEIIRGWTLAKGEPPDTVENRSYSEHVSVEVPTTINPKVFEWGTYVPYEFTFSDGQVRNRRGEISPGRTADRAKLKPPTTDMVKPVK